MPMSPHNRLRSLLLAACMLPACRLFAADTPELLPQGEAGSQVQTQRLAPNVPSRAVTQSKEPQSFLDAQSEMDRRRLLDKQQRTFQLEVDAKYAKALKTYCDTGYGDERCFRPVANKPLTDMAPASATSAVEPTAPAGRKAHPVESRELPSVAQISGFGDELSAILVFKNGRRLRVFAPAANGTHSVLPEGETVVSVRPGEVLVNSPGENRPVPLLFQSSQSSFAGSE